jgi:hypothetical protein
MLLLYIFLSALEIGMIVLSVKIVRRFRQAEADGAKRYVWGIWLTWLAMLILRAIVGERSAWSIIFLLLGYLASYCIALSGMSKARFYLDVHKNKEKREAELQLQKQIDAAVSAAVAQQNAAASPDKEAKA